MKANRQAVVIIHGIGEQKPMSTLRGFVSTMLAQNDQPKNSNRDFYSKPDNLSDLFELRRLTTPARNGRLKTDFYEYYWAYNMRDTKVQQVLKWVIKLLFRFPWNFPKRVVPIHLFLLLLIAGSVVIIIRSGGFDFSMETLPSWLSLVVTIAMSVITTVLTSYVGDAMRYTAPNPSNISERQKIRKDGVDLLRSLHNPERRYQRIIIVGHSLGSIIGYDIIRHLWIECNEKYKDVISPEILADFEREFSPLSSTTFDLAKYRDWQKKIFEQQHADGNPWLISDFITLGNPLTHSSFLLAKDKDELEQRIQERELPSSPPFYESLDKARTITYQPDFPLPRRVLHHACPFACTRWTNIYYGNDFVGGSVKEYFGPGIDEHHITVRKSFFKRWVPFLSHTYYWGDNESEYKNCKESSDLVKKILGFDAPMGEEETKKDEKE